MTRVGRRELSSRSARWASGGATDVSKHTSSIDESGVTVREKRGSVWGIDKPNGGSARTIVYRNLATELDR